MRARLATGTLFRPACPRVPNLAQRHSQRLPYSTTATVALPLPYALPYSTATSTAAPPPEDRESADPQRFYTEYTGDVDRVYAMEERLAPLRDQMIHHEVWGAIRTKAQVRAFMEVHTFAVWDFMTLLKSLQRQLTCVDVDWRPPRLPQLARFINEIVLDEEADVVPHLFKQPISHAELYIQAMREVGADTTAILAFLESLRHGTSVDTALISPGIPAPSIAFIHATRDVLATKQHNLAAVAASFSFGREGVIPDMFTTGVRHLATGDDAKDYSVLIAYLDRHIEVDGGEHGPLARQVSARGGRGTVRGVGVVIGGRWVTWLRRRAQPRACGFTWYSHSQPRAQPRAHAPIRMPCAHTHTTFALVNSC